MQRSCRSGHEKLRRALGFAESTVGQKRTAMTDLSYRMPDVMKALHRLDGEGIDFEPYEAFYSPDETTDWIRAWTGNRSLEGRDFRVFGQDSTGGLAAFWLVRQGAEILAQPIVFLGSEGCSGVVARDFADYLWLLAGGLGPMEVVELTGAKRAHLPQFVEFAERHASSHRKLPQEVIATARVEFPTFSESMAMLCR
jgi:hypothetical protein